MCWGGSCKTVRAPDHSNLSANASNVHPCPFQMKCWVRAKSVLPKCASSFATAAFPLLGSSTGTRGARAGIWHWWETSQSPGQFQSASSALFPGACVLFMSRVSVSYSPPFSPIGFQTSLRDSSSWCWTPELGCQIYSLLTPQGGSLSLCDPPHLP